jgi:hypothetical protein
VGFPASTLIGNAPMLDSMWAADDAPTVPIPWWDWAGFGGFTILGLVEHMLFKAGGYRAMARWYFDSRQPFYVRNLPFAALPFALMFACWTVVAVISRLQGQLWADLLGLPIGLLSFVLFGWGIKRQLRPPDSAKPGWLKAEEARRQSSPSSDT